MSPMSTDHASRLARGDELDYRSVRTGMVFVLLFCLGFTVIGLCLVGGGEGLLRMLGVALLVFFGAVGIPVAAWRLVKPAIELKVSAQDGVWLRDRGSAWLGWDEIAAVERDAVGARPAVTLRLTEGGSHTLSPTIAASPAELYALLSEQQTIRARRG